MGTGMAHARLQWRQGAIQNSEKVARIHPVHRLAIRSTVQGLLSTIHIRTKN